MDKKYIPLYRKYRPQKLEEIVGQEHIKKALTNAIETDRISHAYLFTGPRGTGKTSTARIFAKSLNCEKGPTINPCNECINCQNITNSVPIDVIEIDAASNRSVSDAEEIIQNVAMSAVNSRYKIYIIDEVHMISDKAFNALLKTLEEPPQNVVFILATTEAHKVLDTIKSRCQRFDFKRITTDDITAHLRYIADKENINISDDALKYIALNSAGGMRDSIALLDQLSVLNSKTSTISVEDINKMLGRLSFEDLTELFTAISQSNQAKAIEILNNIYNQGNEPSQILSNLLDYLRNVIVIKTTGDAAKSILQLNEEQISILSSKVSNLEVHQVISLTNKCANYIKELKLSSNPKLWLDISILDMANLTENTKLEDLQSRLSKLESEQGGKMINVSAYNTPPSPVVKPEIKMPNKITAQEATKISVENTKKSSSGEITTPVKPVENITVEQTNQGDIKDLWGSFLNNISSFPSRAILKQQAIPVKLTSEEIIIAIKNPTWLKNFSPDGERFAFLQESAKAVFNTEPKIIVRSPQAGDDQIRASVSNNDKKKTEPKKPLIVENNIPSEEIIKEVVSLKNNDSITDDKEEQDSEILEDSETSDDTADSKERAIALSKSDAAYHSDNVNMVLDLFEGKIIE